MNLIKADFYRIVRDKILYALVAAIVILTFIVVYVYQLMDVQGIENVGDILLKCIGTDTLCTILGVATAFFMGKDYEQNTIRGKLCYGESRYKIYFSKLIEGYLLAMLFFAVAAISGAVFGGIWYEHQLGEDFWNILFCQFAIVIAFSSAMTTICVCSKSIRVPLIVTILFFVILNPVTIFLPQMQMSTVTKYICRGLYSVVSSMLLASTGNVYEAVRTSWENGIRTEQITEFSNMYQNALMIAAGYTIVSIVIAFIVVRKQEYK